MSQFREGFEKAYWKAKKNKLFGGPYLDADEVAIFAVKYTLEKVETLWIEGKFTTEILCKMKKELS